MVGCEQQRSCGSSPEAEAGSSSTDPFIHGLPPPRTSPSVKDEEASFQMRKVFTLQETIIMITITTIIVIIDYFELNEEREEDYFLERAC